MREREREGLDFRKDGQVLFFFRCSPAKRQECIRIYSILPLTIGHFASEVDVNNQVPRACQKGLRAPATEAAY